MPWIHLETSEGLRLWAPSGDPPPHIDNMSELYGSPLSSRIFHCYRSVGDGYAEEMLVVTQKQNMGSNLGDITITVGGTGVTEGELEVTLDIVSEALSRTCSSGFQILLDTLCVAHSPSDCGNPRCSVADYVRKDVLEYDGLGNGNVTSTDCSGRRVASWDNADCKQRGKDQVKEEARRCLLARRKATLFFVLQDIVPISFLFCRLERQTYTSPVSSLPAHSRKDLKLLEGLAQCSCQCLFAVVSRSLAVAYNKEGTSCEQLCDSKTGILPFVAFFSISGLLVATPSFFAHTDHRGRHLLAALAVDQLSCWPHNKAKSGPKEPSQLIHVRSISLQCRGGGTPLAIVLLSIGSAVCCVLGFSAVGQEATDALDYNKFMHFAERRLATSRTIVPFGSADGCMHDEDSVSEEKEGELAPVHPASGVTQEAKDVFTSHLALCIEVTHPTPRFNELLQEMGRIEAETIRTGVECEGSAPKKSVAPPSRCACSCYVCFPCGRAKPVSNRFVWHKEATTLSLDMMWCVAASHVVVAEAHVRNKGWEANCHSLFLLMCNGNSDGDMVNQRRYGVGWFQHSWHSTLCGKVTSSSSKGSSTGQAAAANRNIFNSSGGAAHVDCVKVLQGLTSLGGGPRTCVKYEKKKIAGCLPFTKKTEINMQQKDNTPIFTSGVTVFPLPTLHDNFCEVTGLATDGGDGKVRVMTAFYGIVRQVIKGTNREALVQEAVLMEGDEVDREENVSALIQRQSRSSDVPFAAFHDAAVCIVENVWCHLSS